MVITSHAGSDSCISTCDDHIRRITVYTFYPCNQQNVMPWCLPVKDHLKQRKLFLPSMSKASNCPMSILSNTCQGILITSNLIWSQHISNLHLKARRLIGMLYRKFHRDANSSTLYYYSYTSHSSGLISSTALQCGIPILQRTWSCWKKHRNLD